MPMLQHVDGNERTRLRLLENWLPLAQAENSEQHWELNAEQIEALIVIAAPALRAATNTLTARAILWYHRRQIMQEAP
ncbi:MAG: hypothetical protein WCF99_15485 [Chloroflexales bacterium]